MSEYKRWMIAVTVVLLAIVEVLDITIVAVALLNMKGALSASPNQITWTITVYVVAAAIFMPLTGFLSKRFGRKQLLIVSALGFGLASLLCGFAGSLVAIIVFRALQGVFGALLPSLAQSTLVDTFKGKDLNKAMALFGVGIMLGPILGPILGGYITDYMGWRWIFFVNVPVCIIGAYMAYKFLPKSTTEKIKADWTGLLLLAFGVGALQFFLDKGNEDGWLSSHVMQVTILISIFSIAIFIVRGIGKKDNIVNFTIFKDKNYTLSCILMLLYCAALIGTFSWLPLWMEVFLNYPASTAGLVLMPRGVSCLTIIFLTPMLLKYVDARIWVVLASILYAVGTYGMTHFDLQMGPEAIFWPNLIQGMATGFFFVPLTALAYQSMPGHLYDAASGMFNFFRSLGSSIGVAIFSTVMVEEAQVNWHSMASHIAANSPALQHWLQVQHLNIHDSIAYAKIAQILVAQGNMIAFNDANYLFTFLCLLMIPFVFFIKGKKGEVDMGAH